ncbi:MAG: ABC transporter ATP-binding protein, partial [Myxococcales bacterium]|nr:ABC transporter ATP-binding protein [Myxococcales bacterium]
FVRSLATRIWDVHDGEVEIYPGTLDEYMDHHRRRREGEEAVSDAAASELRGAPGAPTGDSASKPDDAAAKSKGGGKSGAPADSESRESAKERRRREAEARRLRQKRLGPLQRKVAKMEAQIAALEDSQRERSAQLADPAIYEDEARRNELLNAYQRDARVVEELTGEWE